MPADASETIPAAAPTVLDETNLSRSVARLAWPVLIQQVSFSMVQLVDTFLVGHLGEDALAGVRLAGQVFWFTQAGVLAASVGATAVIARNVGAGQHQLASATLRNALFMAFLWGTAVGLGMWFFADWGLGLMGAEEGAKHQGGVYMRAAALGMPLTALMFVGNGALQGAGDTKTPMLIGLVVNVVNIIVAYGLINGPGPLPRLEVLGSGAGYTSSAIVGTLLVLGVLTSGTRIIRWAPWRALDLDSGESRRILNVGLPAGLEHLQFNVAFMIYTRIIAGLGTTALAAHGVALAIQGLTFNAGFALNVAAMTMVGQALGARRPDLAERSAYTSLRYAFVVMTTVALVLMVARRPIVGLFVGGPTADEVVDTGSWLLFIFAFAMPGLALSLSLGGSLRGAGDTRAVLGIMAFGTWGLRLVPAYLLANVVGLGVPGAWLAAILDINSRGILMLLRFRQGRWKQIKV